MSSGMSSDAGTDKSVASNFIAEPHLQFETRMRVCVCVCAGWWLPSVKKVCKREAEDIPLHADPVI